MSTPKDTGGFNPPFSEGWGDGILDNAGKLFRLPEGDIGAQYAPIPSKRMQTREEVVKNQETVPEHPGTPTDPGSYGTVTEGLGLADDVGRFIYGDDRLPYRPQMAITPAREDFNPVGRDNYEQATQVQPQAGAAAVQEAGQAKANAGQQLGDFYTGERTRQEGALAAQRAQQLRDQQEYEVRVRKLDEATDAITRHRLDQGRWWKNPGNIVSALGAAAVQLGTDSPGIGMRLVNGAVERDLQVQRAEHEWLQADKQGLETNVGMFRQLAGDKQGGDMLHEAKMRETAALKIQEIGAQLQSKEAVASAKAISAQMLQQAAQLRMMAHAQLVYKGPTLQTQSMANALMQGDVTAFPKINPATGAPVTPGQPGVPPAGQPGSSPNAAQAPAQGQMRQMQEFQRTGEAPKKGSSLETEARFAVLAKQVEERIGVPGAGHRMMMWRNDVRNRATQQGHMPGTPGYYKFLDGERIQAIKDASEPAKALHGGKLLPSYTAAKQLQGELNKLQSEVGDPKKIDALLGQDWKMAVGADLNRKVERAKEAFGWSDDQAEAARRFSQTFQRSINAYTRALSGGAVTDGEQQRIWQEVQNSGSFDSIRHWSNLVSESHGAELTAAIQTSPSLVGQYMAMLQMGIKAPGLPSQGIPRGRRGQ